jgi:hypothetical protein
VAILFEVIDPFGDKVQLSDDKWNTHILASHPEMAPYLDLLFEAIENPHAVLRSSTASESKLFYRRGVNQGRYANLYCKVVVGYDVSPATIRTAFFTSNLTGGEIIWLKYP